MTTSPQIFSKLIMGLSPHDTPCVPRAKLTIPTFMKIRYISCDLRKPLTSSLRGS